MKKLSAALCFFILSTMIVLAQAPDKSSAIIITVADSNAAKAAITKVLADRDYVTGNSKQANVINTTAKTLKSGARVNYIFTIKGSEITLTGKLPVAGQAGTTIVSGGAKGTPMMNGWEEMEKIAKALGGKVTYK